jgi:hypothetical protein
VVTAVRKWKASVMYQPWSSTTQAPPPTLDRLAWVYLDRLYGEPDNGIAGADHQPPGG